MRTPSSWLRLSAVVIVLAFVILAVLGILRTYTPVPRGDDWDGSIEFFMNVSDGDWRQWFGQFAEHRPILPRLLYWSDIKFFGGRFVLPLVGGLIFAAGVWAMFLWTARAVIYDRSTRFTIGATITLLVTSWLQIPNLAIGFNSAQAFMVMFLVLTTLIATAMSKNNDPAFYVALICGIAAAGTMANGIVALPLAAVLAYLIGLEIRRVATIIVVASVVILGYFTDYIRPEIHGSPLVALTDPVGIVRYTLGYIGNVAFYIAFVAMSGVDMALALVSGESANIGGLNDHPIAYSVGLSVAQFVGFGLVTVTTVLAWHWLRSNRDPLRGALIIFLIFVDGVAAGTALGRLSAFGIEQSIAARYTTPTLFALAAVVLLIAGNLTLRQANILFLSIALLLLPRQLTALRSRAIEHAQLEQAMNAVAEKRDSVSDRHLLGDPEIVERVANRLRAMPNPTWKWQR